MKVGFIGLGIMGKKANGKESFKGRSSGLC